MGNLQQTHHLALPTPKPSPTSPPLKSASSLTSTLAPSTLNPTPHATSTTSTASPPPSTPNQKNLKNLKILTKSQFHRDTYPLELTYSLHKTPTAQHRNHSQRSTSINTDCIITVAKTTAKTAAIPTPSVPSTPTPPATPQLPPTSVHKPTFQYPTSCSSTSPSDLVSIYPPHPSPYLCHPRSHPPPSFPTLYRISSGWDSRGLPYHLHNNNQRRSPSHGTSQGTTYTFKINQKRSA